MSYFSDKLNEHLTSVGLKPYKLAQLLKARPKELSLSEQYVYALCRGEKTPQVDTLEKLAAVPELGLSLAVLKAWRAIDEYGLEVLRIALEEKLKEERE